MGKKLILTISIFFGFISFTLKAQEIEYTYDEAGNRIKKEFIITGSTNSPGSTSQNRNKEIFTDEIDSTSVKIYPNPTQGIVNLSFDKTNPEGYSFINIKVIDLNGSILYENNEARQNLKFDFGNFSNGIYIIQLQNNENVSNWRIIKQ